MVRSFGATKMKMEMENNDKEFCSNPRCIAQRDERMAKELFLEKQFRDLVLEKKVFLQRIKVFQKVKNKFQTEKKGKLKEHGTDEKNTETKDPTNYEDVQKLLDKMDITIERFDGIKFENLPRWKQQLNNTKFVLSGGHVFKHFEPQLEWRSLEQIIDGNDLSDEAVHFLCSLSIFVPETHKLYKSVANGTVHTSLIEPFQVEWIMLT